MNNLSALTAQPKTLTVKGKVYKVHPLDLGDFGCLQEWIDRQFPDPFKEVEKAIAGGSWNWKQQEFLLKEALATACQPRHLIGTPLADELLLSIEGVKQTLFLSIRKGDPEFTEKDAEELFAEMSLVDAAMVGQATNIDMVATDPKSDELSTTPPSAPSGLQASRRQRRASRRSTGGKSSTTR